MKVLYLLNGTFCTNTLNKKSFILIWYYSSKTIFPPSPPHVYLMHQSKEMDGHYISVDGRTAPVPFRCTYAWKNPDEFVTNLINILIVTLKDEGLTIV